MKASLYQLLLVNDHVVSQIVKSKFIIRNISNITVICSLTFCIIITVQNNTHPLSITFCQIIIDGNDVYTFSFQCIQICRKCGYQGLTFTGFHLRNTSLVQYHTTHKLYTVVLHAKNTSCCLSYCCKCLRKQIV